MQLGVIGLGRMGSNIVRRLERGGHRCVVYDVDPGAVTALAAEGAVGTASLEDLVSSLEPPRRVWVMLPAGAVTEKVVASLGRTLTSGDTVIDGGNTYYRDDIRRAAELESDGISYVDVGTSGGVFGLERGFCLMIGGTAAAVAALEPLFETLAPGVEAAPRTEPAPAEPRPAEYGFLHCGPPGAGHFVKMVHNGIEYGMMAALAEGLNILHNADVGLRPRAFDAETAPLDHPEHYAYELDVPAIAELWRRGSVVSSWLLDLTAEALHASPALDGLTGRVSDSGEGRWTAIAAIEAGVPADVLTAALYTRFSSRGEADFANRLLSAMRARFGGHAEKPA